MKRDVVFKKKKCRFCIEKIEYIDYKDAERLKRHLTEKGKIIYRKITGNCASHQRKLAVAIKRARNIALLPYVTE
ncbi:30S ribosomal protein S18 [Candidatus Auribacterota bacterium]